MGSSAWRGAVGVLVLLAGCPTPGRTLRVDVRTDLSVTTEFDALEVEISGPESRRADAVADPATDYLLGSRIARFDQLPQGEYAVTVRLTRAGEPITSSRALVAVRGSHAVTLVVTRSCIGVTCGESERCWNRECVPASCTPETPEPCPDPICAIDADCGGGVMRCLAGECFSPRDAACPTSASVAPVVGCVRPLEALSVGGGSLNRVAIDGRGRVLLTGQTARASQEFVAVDSDGRVAWSHTVTSTSLLQCQFTAAIDGRFMAPAWVAGTADFAGGVIGPTDAQDAALLIFGDEGDELAARVFAGPENDQAKAVARLPSGDLLLVGHFVDSVVVGEGGLESRGRDDIFATTLAASDPALPASRVLHVGGPDEDIANDVAVRGDRFVIAGFSDGPIEGEAGPAFGGRDALLVGGDVAAVRWTLRIGSPRSDRADVVVDAEDGFWIGGSIGGPAEGPGGARLDAFGRQDGFIASIDEDGGLRFTATIGGPGDDEVDAIARGRGSRMLVSGVFSGTADVFGRSLTSDAMRDGFVASLEADGRLVDVLHIRGTGDVQRVLVQSSSGTAAAAIAFTGELDIEGIRLEAVADPSFVVLSFTP